MLGVNKTSVKNWQVTVQDTSISGQNGCVSLTPAIWDIIGVSVKHLQFVRELFQSHLPVTKFMGCYGCTVKIEPVLNDRRALVATNSTIKSQS